MILTTTAVIVLVGSSAIIGVSFSYLFREREVAIENILPSSRKSERQEEEEMKVRDALQAAVSSTKNKSRQEFVAARLAASASQKGQYGGTDHRDEAC